MDSKTGKANSEILLKFSIRPIFTLFAFYFFKISKNNPWKRGNFTDIFSGTSFSTSNIEKPLKLHSDDIFCRLGRSAKWKLNLFNYGRTNNGWRDIIIQFSMEILRFITNISHHFTNSKSLLHRHNLLE